MLFDAQQPIVLEQGPRGDQRIVQPAEPADIVNLAEDQHPVHRAVQAFGQRADIGPGHLRAAGIDPASSLRGQALTIIAHTGHEAGGTFGNVRIEADIVAALTQIGDQHPAEPAACGHEIDHIHAGADIEEGQCFSRMAILVARAIRLTARVREHGFERVHVRRGAAMPGMLGNGRNGSEGTGGHQCGGEKGGDAHGILPESALLSLYLERKGGMTSGPFAPISCSQRRFWR